MGFVGTGKNLECPEKERRRFPGKENDKIIVPSYSAQDAMNGFCLWPLCWILTNEEYILLHSYFSLPIYFFLISKPKNSSWATQRGSGKSFLSQRSTVQRHLIHFMLNILGHINFIKEELKKKKKSSWVRDLALTFSAHILNGYVQAPCWSLILQSTLWADRAWSTWDDSTVLAGITQELWDKTHEGNTQLYLEPSMEFTSELQV